MSNDGELYITTQADGYIHKLCKDGRLSTIGIFSKRKLDEKSERTSVFNAPRGIVMDQKTRELFIADFGLHVVKKVSFNNDNEATVSTIAGNQRKYGHIDGIGSVATFGSPYGVALHKRTGNLYVTDYGTSPIRKLIRPKHEGQEWIVETIPVSLPHNRSHLFQIAVDESTGNLYLASSRAGLLQITDESKMTSLPVPPAYPNGIATDVSGIFLACSDHTIKKIDFHIPWSISNHSRLPSLIKQIIKLMTLTNTVTRNSYLSHTAAVSQLPKLPKEILMHVFSFISS
jgi:DNA-binding beta-propeller fold protein YncE